MIITTTTTTTTKITKIIMLTNSIKSYLQLISLKKLFGQSSIYNFFRLKKHFISIKQFISVEKKIIRIKNISFQFKIIHFDLKKLFSRLNVF